MVKINELSSALVSKIAAGEVVDNPAAIIKELVENSIDAGATEISITFEDAGKSLIVIEDNGIGIAEDDLLLAVKRNATSKIKDINDLETINTLGFRGEALAAIAAVSHFEISSAENEDGKGSKAKFIGGKFISQEPTSVNKGTIIKVEKLFFNTPARFKFLKSDKSETSRILSGIPRIIFCYPNIRVQIKTGKNLIVYPQALSIKERLGQILNQTTLEGLIEIKSQNENILIEGFASDPAYAKDYKTQQWIAVNKRFVVSPAVQNAIQYRGYHSLLMKGKYPQYFINISIPANQVDANVHPKKIEVKFANELLVNTIVSEAFHKAISHQKTATLKPESSITNSPISDKSYNGYSGLSDIKQPAMQFSYISRSSSSSYSKAREDDYNEVKNKTPNPEKQERLIDTASLPEITDTGIYLLGQFDKYIVAYNKTGLLIFDSHASHERILFEKIKNQFQTQDVQSYPLIEEQIMKIAPFMLYMLEEYKAFWIKLGFEFRFLSNSEIGIVAIPSIIKEKYLQKIPLSEILTSIFNELAEFEKTNSIDNYYHQVFASLACHSAIRGRENMNSIEINNILNQLLTIKDIDLYCPHGRPVMQQITISQLDKLFKRII